jgi:aminopeptidase N
MRGLFGALAVVSLLAGGPPALAQPTPPVAHDLAVRIDPAARTLAAEDRIVVAPGPARTLTLADRFKVESLSIDGRTAPAPSRAQGLFVWKIPASERPRVIEAKWSGSLAALDTTLDHRQTLSANAPVSGEQGTFLPGAARWYPNVEDALARFRVAIDLPAGQKGLVPGRLLEEREADGRYRARFAFDAPTDAIDLMAGPYRIESRDVKGAGGTPLKLRTYFHPQVADLAGPYLDAVARYIDLYESRIGEYPFTEFSVVSSPTPTGFGMPSLTYLGVDVVRLPFIRDTSLGHEVLHNWWGNGVYPDYARGNWSEGLTTFMADYAFKERESAEAAREMRLAWLRDLAAVPPGQDRPLGEFASRTHGTSQIVGYNKAAMMFFALRDLIGEPAFDEGLKRFWREHRFQVASWADLERAFAQASGRDLAPFFSQWLGRAGLPAVRLVDAKRESGERPHRTSVTIEQGAPAYRLRVPLVVRTESGEERKTVDLDRERGTFVIDTVGRAESVTLDPDLRMLRRLGSGEAPPILRQVMVDPATVTMLLPASGRALDAARELAAKLQDHAPRLASAGRPTASPMLVIGLDAEVDAWLATHGLAARPAGLAAKGTAQVWTLARSGAGPLAIVSARDADALAALARPLPHYGRQSYLAFDGAKAIERGVWPSQPQRAIVR